MDSNNSSSNVVQSQGHENNENLPHNVGSQQVAHSEENPDGTRSVMNKVRAKAKKFKDTFMKHGQNVFEHGNDHPNQDHHIPNDHDLDEDEEMDEDQEVHQAPIHESEVVRSATPTSQQVENSEKLGVSFGGTTVKGDKPHQEPRVVGVSPTTETNQNITTDPAKTFVGEEESGKPKVSLEEDPYLSGSRHEAYTHPKYQTEVTDLTGAGTTERDITPVEKSFAGMKVQDEPKPSQEPKVLPNVAVNQSPPAGSQNQFESDLSAATKTQDPSAESHEQYMPELSSANKTQYPSAESHDQYKPELSSANKTEYPTVESHDQYKPELSSANKTEYPTVESHDQYMPELSSANKTSAESHDQYMPELSNADKTQYPSAESHDQYMPELSSADKTQYPSVESHDQYKPELSSADKTEYPSVESHDQYMPELSSANKTSAERHDQYMPELSNADKTQYPSVESHDQYMPELSSANKTQYPSAGSHDQFEPDFSNAVKTEYPSDGSHDQFAPETKSTSTNKYHEDSEAAEQTFNTATTKVEEQPSYESVEKPSSQSSYTDEIAPATYAADRAVSDEHTADSEFSYGEKGDREDKVTIDDEQKKSGDASNVEYGKNTAPSLTEKLAPVYGKVAGVGSALKSKLSGTGTGTNTADGTETGNEVKDKNKGGSVKDYLAEKLRPGEEDKALSEVISEALHKRKEEPKKASGDEDRAVTEAISDDTKKRGEEETQKVSEESSVNSPGKGMVDKLKGVVGSWFTKSGENQSTQGDECLSKNKNSDAELEQVAKGECETKLKE